MAASLNASAPPIASVSESSSNSLRPALERLGEALLLLADDALDRLGVLDDLGIPRPDLLDDDRRQSVNALEPDPPRLGDGAPDQPPEDVAATLVRRRDPLRGEERHPAAVVADHAVRLRRLGRAAVRDPRFARDPVHDQLEAVGVEDRLGLLEQHGAALEPHPGVDVLVRERGQRAVRGEVELHEDEVPELEEALAALAARRAVGLAAAVLRAAVVVELGAGPARAGRACRSPEVLGARQPDDPLARNPDSLPAGDRRLVLAEPEPRIAGEDGRPDPVAVEPHLLGRELPGEVDRAVLEVVAEREVSEHLEHRRVPGGQADLVQIGVLAAGAQHLLHGREPRRGRLLRAGEVRLQRLHPR